LNGISSDFVLIFLKRKCIKHAQKKRNKRRMNKIKVGEMNGPESALVATLMCGAGVRSINGVCCLVWQRLQPGAGETSWKQEIIQSPSFFSFLATLNKEEAMNGKNKKFTAATAC
jgi:hypothetical protein